MSTPRFPLIAIAILATIGGSGCAGPSNDSTAAMLNPAAGLRDADSDGDGSVSRAEFDAQAHARFNTLDSDQSESLDRAEFQAAFDAAIARLPWAIRRRASDRANPDRAFSDRDTDGDGVISRSESLSDASRAFGRFDLDGNGILTPDEAAAIREQARNTTRNGTG